MFYVITFIMFSQFKNHLYNIGEIKASNNEQIIIVNIIKTIRKKYLPIKEEKFRFFLVNDSFTSLSDILVLKQPNNMLKIKYIVILGKIYINIPSNPFNLYLIYIDEILKPIVNDLKNIIINIIGNPIIHKPKHHIIKKYNKLLVKFDLNISNFEENDIDL